MTTATLTPRTEGRQVTTTAAKFGPRQAENAARLARYVDHGADRLADAISGNDLGEVSLELTRLERDLAELRALVARAAASNARKAAK